MLGILKSSQVPLAINPQGSYRFLQVKFKSF